MLARFNQFIADNRLFTKGEKLLLAMSGGADSMVLAHLLLQAGYRFDAAHCNFQLRGTESAKDEVFVKDWCAVNNVPLNLKRFVLETNENIQNAARKARYDWFAKLMDDNKIDKLITAHHATDNVETLFINLLRGAGHKGWSGIPLNANRNVRPLLFASKKEVLEFAKHEGISFRNDESNFTDKYLRNKIRIHVLPELHKINPNADEIISQNQLRLQSSNKLLKVLVETVNKHAVTFAENGVITIRYRDLEPNNFAHLLLFELIQEYGFQWWQIEAVFSAKQAGGVLYSKSHRLLIGIDSIQIQPLSSVKSEHQPVLIFPEENSLDVPVNLLWESHDLSEMSISKDPQVATLDLEKLQFPLLLRKWNKGDRFIPLGMTGSKLLSDYLTDKKLNKFEKERVFVVESAGNIAWVVGLRPDDRYKITTSTKRVFLIKLHQ